MLRAPVIRERAGTQLHTASLSSPTHSSGDIMKGLNMRAKRRSQKSVRHTHMGLVFPKGEQGK